LERDCTRASSSSKRVGVGFRGVEEVGGGRGGGGVDIFVDWRGGMGGGEGFWGSGCLRDVSSEFKIFPVSKRTSWVTGNMKSLMNMDDECFNGYTTMYWAP